MTALSEKALALAELMTNGSEFAETIDGRVIPADWPLDLKQAALVTNMKLREARKLADDPRFVEQLNKLLKERRSSERARNLNVAIEIRDDKGEASRPIGPCGSRQSPRSSRLRARASR